MICSIDRQLHPVASALLCIKQYCAYSDFARADAVPVARVVTQRNCSELSVSRLPDFQHHDVISEL